MKYITFFTWLFIGINVHAQSELSQNNLNKTLETVYKLLPREVINYKISVKFKNDSKNGMKNFCEPDNQNLYAVASTVGSIKTIFINTELVNKAITDKNIYPCMHGTYQRLLEATLIHELMHFYDQKNQITNTTQFQSLVGGNTFYKQKGRRLQNNQVTGSVDTYEYKNYKESFAVNFEYFIMDETFKCKKPAYYTFFKDKTKLDPFSSMNCGDDYNTVLLTQNDIDGNLTSKVKLDRSRLYQIHYLFAGKGKGMMSRWGHAMYRLVMCAPERKTVGPECLQDISHHLVVSYRASISSLAINSVQGLVGKYPSQIFVYQISDIIEEYTKGELRDLWSVPLNLNETELTNFLNLTIQRFWDYSGKYYFTTNNCATESKKHLLGSVDESRPDVGAWNPLKMFKKIRNEENSYLGDQNYLELTDEELVNRGYLFRSKEQGMLESIERLNAYGFLLPVKLKELNKTLVNSRFDQYQTILNSKEFSSLSPDKQFILIVDILRVEKYQTAKFQQHLSEEILGFAKQNANIKRQVEELTQKNPYFFSTQWKIVENQSYGIPSNEQVMSGLNKANNIRKQNSTIAQFLDIFKDQEVFQILKDEFAVFVEMDHFLKSSLRKIN